jgi:hypothetical protein
MLILLIAFVFFKGTMSYLLKDAMLIHSLLYALHQFIVLLSVMGAFWEKKKKKGQNGRIATI